MFYNKIEAEISEILINPSVTTAERPIVVLI